MQISTNIIIPGSKNKPIGIDVFYKKNGQPKPVAIFVHGFKGFKDWGHFNFVAKTFAESNFVFVKFNFSHNGVTTQNPLVFDDLEAFGNNNYIIELEDLNLVINWVLENSELTHDIDKDQINLIGHSRGGGISILKAAEDKRISKLVTWASVSDFINRNKTQTIKTWKDKGVVHTFNTRTNQQMPLYVQFYDTLMQHKSRLDIGLAAQNLSIPYLIIHGTKDEAVSVNDAHDLHQACQQSQLLIIDGAGHTFEAKHPFTELVLPDNAKIVVENTIQFFKS